MNESIAYLTNTLKENDTVTLGLSGGPDSMCLLNLLLSLPFNLNIIALHINHNIRKSSDTEAEFVKEYCSEHGVTFEYIKFPKKSENEDFSENELRIKRYNFFDEMTKKYNAKYLLTAHHGDDLIETILMRITRGSNLKGYSGFQIATLKETYTILKPLIYVTKDQIEKYLNKNNIPFVTDETNNTDIYTRNRYRHHVLPFLKEEEKNIHTKYLQFSLELQKYFNFVDKQVEKEVNKRYVDNSLDINSYNELDEFIQTKIIEYILHRLYLNKDGIVTNTHLTNILLLINSNKPNSEIYLPESVIVRKEYNKLSFITKDEDINDYKIEFKQEVTLSNNHTIKQIKESDNNSNFIIRLNSSELKLPLYIRNRRTGDKMIIKNMDNYKKIKDIFIDSKLTKSERISQPILVDSEDNILWLPGLKKSKFDKAITENYDIILKYD